MTDLQWQGHGSDLTIQLLGRPWNLPLDNPKPGLCRSDGPSTACLLGLHHISTTGRRDEGVFVASSLIEVECHRGRVQATFEPRGWHGLRVRAAWEPTPDRDGFDLEVQVSVASTGTLRRFEVAVDSRLSETAGLSRPDRMYRVEPRDVHAAGTSYDGREPPNLLHSLTTMPVPATSPHALPPLIIGDPGVIPGKSYVEMVRPDDCARRIAAASGDTGPSSDRASSLRYGLFGHDLEKGVVLRGRIRGIWVDSASLEGEVRRQHERFLEEPPSLGP